METNEGAAVMAAEKKGEAHYIFTPSRIVPHVSISHIFFFLSFFSTIRGQKFQTLKCLVCSVYIWNNGGKARFLLLTALLNICSGKKKVAQTPSGGENKLDVCLLSIPLLFFSKCI